MDTYCRKIVGWSIDNVQNAQLVVNALDEHLRSLQEAGVATTG